MELVLSPASLLPSVLFGRGMGGEFGASKSESTDKVTMAIAPAGSTACVFL